MTSLQSTKMTHIKPYLLRACYEWIVDNHYTPHILVNAEIEGVSVPTQYVEKGKIILNVSPSATQHLLIHNHSIEFKASFGGLVQHIKTPMSAVLAIYAKENNRGMTFEQEGEAPPPPTNEPPKPPKPTKGKPKLKLVK